MTARCFTIMAKQLTRLIALLVSPLLLSGLSANALAQLPDDPRDLSGVWMNDNTLDERLKRLGIPRLDPNAPAPPRGETDGPAELLTPEYLAIYEAEQARLANLAVGTQACGWVGMPRIMTYPYPFEILHSPGRITIIYEAESQVRRVYMDRDEHLPFDELDPSYNGDSIGWWEDDTLVIDTVGFNTLTTVGRGLPHSEDMHIVERWVWADADTINVEMTISDPLAFQEPMVQTIQYSKRPTWTIKEYHCLENNRDAPDEAGERSGGLAN
jgi:hypothetical protein